MLSNQGGVYSVVLLPDPLRRLVKANAACGQKIKEMIGIIMRTLKLSDSPNGYIGATVTHQHHTIILSPSAIGTSPISIHLKFGGDIEDVMNKYKEDVGVEERVAKRKRIEDCPMDTS
jgi:hypothetical protein